LDASVAVRVESVRGRVTRSARVAIEHPGKCWSTCVRGVAEGGGRGHRGRACGDAGRPRWVMADPRAVCGGGADG